jgi:uncharacterized protein (UPF0371 family)
MPMLNIKLDGDNCWPDLADKPEGELIETQTIEVALLPGGMSSGKASVAIRIDLPDGRTVIAQTSQELFDAAARAFRGRLEYLAELARKGGSPS